MNNKVTIPNDKDKLTGTLFFPKKIKPKNPAVIFLHGWTSDETGYKPRAEALANIGYIGFTVSLRGHGESFGKLEEFSRMDHLEDALATYDFLTKQKEVDQNNISLVGASYGGYIGALLAGKRKINRLAMRAPALYRNTDFDTNVSDLVKNEEEFFQDIQPEYDNFALEGVKAVNKILLIESEHDQIIPHKIFELYAKAISDKTKLKHIVIQSADHQLSTDTWKQEFINILIEWFANKNE